MSVAVITQAAETLTEAVAESAEVMVVLTQTARDKMVKTNKTPKLMAVICDMEYFGFILIVFPNTIALVVLL